VIQGNVKKSKELLLDLINISDENKIPYGMAV